MRTACEQSFKTKKARKAPQKNKSVPWWTHELTAARKITNYLRSKYQRTRDNAEQREINKEAYFARNAIYEATIKREKSKSWEEYCNVTMYNECLKKGIFPERFTKPKLYQS